MNRIGLKDYLLNEASDSDLLDCAKVYDCYRFNGYGHLESVSNESLLEDARDEIDNIIDWLEGASRYELMDVSSDVELFVTADDPLDIINDVDCSVRSSGDTIEVSLCRGSDSATLSFSKFNIINADDVNLANAAYATVRCFDRYADGSTTDEVQARFFEDNGRRLSGVRANELTESCEKNMDALKQVLDDDEIDALGQFFDVELCSETYLATASAEAREDKTVAMAFEKLGVDIVNSRSIDRHAELEAKQRVVLDEYDEDSYDVKLEQLDKFFGSGRADQSEIINDSWGNSILVKGGNGLYNGSRGGITVYENFEKAVDTSESWHGGDNIFADCEIDGMWDENGSLFVTGAHHDGRACVEMRQLTDKGEELYSCHQVDDGFHLPEAGFETMGFVYREGDEDAFIHDLWDNPEMCSRPRFAWKALDMPAEEYIMVHDGVKTEFQITEVKEDSFAYDQGARYDAKVLTNGHDCGNGRFCADLSEAHEFCQQFADSVVGLGESLDDMCEDRCEVASLAQDVDAGNRDQEDRNHDNSEIGE